MLFVFLYFLPLDSIGLAGVLYLLLILLDVGARSGLDGAGCTAGGATIIHYWLWATGID